MVILAETPAQAIDLYHEDTAEIDLLITDVIMPEMNGFDLEQTLKRSRPLLKSLFISGYTSDVIAHHGILDDEICFLQKPFSREALAQKVWLALHRG